MSDRPQAIALPINEHALPTTYSNYFRVSGSAEERILDFGLDPQRHTDEDAERADAPRRPRRQGFGVARRDGR